MSCSSSQKQNCFLRAPLEKLNIIMQRFPGMSMKSREEMVIVLLNKSCSVNIIFIFSKLKRLLPIHNLLLKKLQIEILKAIKINYVKLHTFTHTVLEYFFQPIIISPIYNSTSTFTNYVVLIKNK